MGNMVCALRQLSGSPGMAGIVFNDSTRQGFFYHRAGLEVTWQGKADIVLGGRGC